MSASNDSRSRALTLGSDPFGLVTYDARLADAARGEGLEVLAPS